MTSHISCLLFVMILPCTQTIPLKSKLLRTVHNITIALISANCNSESKCYYKYIKNIYMKTKGYSMFMEVNPSCKLALSLFVSRVFTNNHNPTFSSYYFALFTDWFYWWSYFHSNLSFPKKSVLYYTISNFINQVIFSKFISFFPEVSCVF